MSKPCQPCKRGDHGQKVTFVSWEAREYKVFSHDVTAAMLVSQSKPLGIQVIFMHIFSFVSVNQYC